MMDLNKQKQDKKCSKQKSLGTTGKALKDRTRGQQKWLLRMEKQQLRFGDRAGQDESLKLSSWTDTGEKCKSWQAHYHLCLPDVLLCFMQVLFQQGFSFLNLLQKPQVVATRGRFCGGICRYVMAKIQGYPEKRTQPAKNRTRGLAAWNFGWCSFWLGAISPWL